MALLPARNILDGTALPVTSQMKTALGSLRDYLAGLLGTDSADPAAARTALGAATRGANADITSLTGLTTPLSMALGGTGMANGFVSSKVASGYQKLPSGLIIQWVSGFAGGNMSAFTNTFPIAFPTAAVAVSGIHNGATQITVVTSDISAASVSMRSSYTINVACSIIAIGY